MKRGLIRMVLDDHRDVAMYRHALFSAYLKARGRYSGVTAHYEDKTGLVRIVFKAIHDLIARNKELEAIVRKHEEQDVDLKQRGETTIVDGVIRAWIDQYGKKHMVKRYSIMLRELSRTAYELEDKGRASVLTDIGDILKGIIEGIKSQETATAR